MTDKKHIEEFVTALQLASKDKRVLEDFLHVFLTPSEMVEFSKRLQIIKLLRSGIPQRKIAEELEVGVATISRGARELQEVSVSISRLLDKLK